MTQQAPTATKTEDVASFPIEETFTEKTTKATWVFKDAQLNGSLELTPDAHHRAGTAVLDEPFSSRHDVTVDFDFAILGGTDPVGDGFLVYLIDGTSQAELTLNGPGLGYALSDNEEPGVSAGYVGIAFDNWGYFAHPAGGSDHAGAGIGGPGFTPGMVGVRGSGQGTEGFRWLAGTKLPERFTSNDRIKVDWDDQAHVQIAIVKGKVTVRLSTKDDPNGTVLIDAFDIQNAPGQRPMPDTLKIGFAAGTGTYTSAHCIRRLKITMPVDMPLEITGPEKAEAGTKVCYPVVVRNDGPNDAPDALVDVALPTQLTQVTYEIKTGNGAGQGQGKVTNGTLRQELNLPKGATATVTVCGTIDPEFTGTLTIPATLTSPTRANTSTRQHGEANTHVTARTTPPTPLVVWQEGGVEDTPDGPGTTLNVCVRTPNWTEQADEGELQHVFTAPTGFRWNGTVSAQYKHKDETTSGDLPPVRATVSDDGRTLTFTYAVHLNTTADDTGALLYICGIQATPGAQPGRHTDGIAQVGTAPPGKLKAEITNPDD